MFLLLAPTELLAQASLSIGNTPGYPGTTVSVPIRVARATNIVGAQFDVAFNAAKLSSGTPTLATPSQLGAVIRSREIAPGVRRTVVYSLNNALLRTNGFGAQIPFQVPANERVGSGPLVPSNVILARSDGTRITPVTLNNGAIFVRPANPLPDGTVQFFLSSQPDKRYVIQATTNLIDWVTITNTTAVGSFMDLVDADGGSYPYRFYRAVPSEIAGELGPVSFDAMGAAHFQLTGLAGRSYMLQASTNLVDWLNIRTFTATANIMDLLDTDAPHYPYRFYRALSPAPVPRFGNVTFGVNGTILFKVSGPSDKTYILQASTNLKDWTNIRTNLAVGGTIDFNVPVEASYPQRFFRVQSR